MRLSTANRLSTYEVLLDNGLTLCRERPFDEGLCRASRFAFGDQVQRSGDRIVGVVDSRGLAFNGDFLNIAGLRVAGAEGPERISPEWWHLEDTPPPLGETHGVRDYYRIEDEGGRRYWVYREGLYRPDRPPAWYLHGFFA